MRRPINWNLKKMFCSYKDFESRLNRLINEYFVKETDETLDKVVSLLRIELNHPRSQPIIWKTTISGWCRNPQTLAKFVQLISKSNIDHRFRIIHLARKDVVGGKLWRFRKPGFKIELTAENSPIFPIFTCSEGALIFRFSRGVLKKSFLEASPRFEGDIGQFVENCACDEHIQIDKFNIAPGDVRVKEDWLYIYTRNYPEKILKLLKQAHQKDLDISFYEYWRENPVPTHIAAKFDLLANESRGIKSSSYQTLEVKRLITGLIKSDKFQPDLKSSRLGQQAQKGTTTYSFPIPKWEVLTDVRIQDSDVITDSKNLYVIDETADPIEDFVSGQWESVYSAPQRPNQALFASKPDSKIRIDSAALVSGRNDSNWYHWVIEYLPRALLMDGQIDSNIPILVSDAVPKAGIELMRSITRRKIITIPRNQSTKVGQLFVISSPIQVFDSTRKNWQSNLIFNDSVLSNLRSKIIGAEAVNPDAKVFLVRESGHRGLTNEAEIAELVKTHGFQIVNPAKLCFNEQLDLFQNAKILMGAGGAVMANYLFANSNARIFALASEAAKDFVLPAAISSISGAHFEYVFGKPVNQMNSFENRIEYIHADFKIRKKKIRELLTQLS